MLLYSGWYGLLFSHTTPSAGIGTRFSSMTESDVCFELSLGLRRGYVRERPVHGGMRAPCVPLRLRESSERFRVPDPLNIGRGSKCEERRLDQIPVLPEVELEHWHRL